MCIGKIVHIFRSSSSAYIVSLYKPIFTVNFKTEIEKIERRYQSLHRNIKNIIYH